MDKLPLEVNARKHWIDYLKVVAIFGIVSVHASTNNYLSYDKIARFHWWLADLLQASFRFGAMLFVMISGCLLLGKNISVDRFYAKRAIRLLPSIFFWNAFYVCFLFYIQTDMSNPIWLIKTGVHALVTGQAYGHLWYLPMFLGLMMLAPFLNMFVKGSKPTGKEAIILTLILLIFVFLDQASKMIETIKGYSFYWYLNAAESIPFFLAGYYLDKYHEEIKISNKSIFSIILSIILTVVVLNFVAADRFDIVNESFIFYRWGPLNLTLTSLLFLLFCKNSDIFKESKVIAAISEATFGIYLVHIVFLYFFHKLLSSYISNSILYMPILIFLVIVMSFTTIHLLRKIKLFRVIC